MRQLLYDFVQDLRQHQLCVEQGQHLSHMILQYEGQPLSLLPSMLAEFTSWAKLTEFVTNHIFRYIYWNVYFAVVDSKILANHVRGDRTSTRPCFDNCPIVSAKLLDFFREFGVYEWTFFKRSTHILLLP